MLLIHQLVEQQQQQQPSVCGADVAPLSPKRSDTIESASIITAGLIGVSLLHRHQKTQRDKTESTPERQRLS